MGVLRWLHARWWGLVIINFIVIGAVFKFIWNYLEPFDVSNLETLPEFAKSRWFFHLLATFLIAPYVTLIIHSLLRWKFWEEESKPDVKKFYDEIEGLLNHVSTLHDKNLGTRDIQKLVKKSVIALSKSYFGVNEPPAPANIPSINPDKAQNCRLCKGKEEEVEVVDTGQCLRCKLYISVWELR